MVSFSYVLYMSSVAEPSDPAYAAQMQAQHAQAHAQQQMQMAQAQHAQQEQQVSVSGRVFCASAHLNSSNSSTT